MRGQPCKERMSTVVATLPRTAALSGQLQVVECAGASGSQTHLPFIREYLRRDRDGDAEALIEQMDAFLDETTKPGKRR
eukprot:5227579-Prymnesium_polylepis.1